MSLVAVTTSGDINTHTEEAASAEGSVESDPFLSKFQSLLESNGFEIVFSVKVLCVCRSRPASWASWTWSKAETERARMVLPCGEIKLCSLSDQSRCFWSQCTCHLFLIISVTPLEMTRHLIQQVLDTCFSWTQASWRVKSFSECIIYRVSTIKHNR